MTLAQRRGAEPWKDAVFRWLHLVWALPVKGGAWAGGVTDQGTDPICLQTSTPANGKVPRKKCRMVTAFCPIGGGDSLALDVTL
jgi:hypothetical protein